MGEYPFTTFNFVISLTYSGGKPICEAEFSECDGLEINLEPKTIREGGNNGQPIHLVGPVSYGQINLKRGMTSNFGLWEWFEAVQAPDGHGIRASGTIAVKAADRKTDQVRFSLVGCLPVKIKAPSLNAKDGQLAIEELSLVHEGMARVKNKPQGAAP